MNLTEYPIQLYHHPIIAEKIHTVLNCYSANERKEVLTPFGEVLSYNIESITQYPIDTKDLETRLNEMRKGSEEEKALYLYMRNTLIEKDCMPIDEEGRAYDISTMYIPWFDINTFLDKLNTDDNTLLMDILLFYQKNKESEDIDDKDFIKCINVMKVASPSRFAKVHEYLVNNKIIPQTPIPKEINLTEDRFMFLAKYDKARADETGKMHMLNYLRGMIEGEPDIDKINNALDKMKYGDIATQAKLYEFCTMMHSLSELEVVNVKEQRSYLIKAAKTKARARSTSAV